MPRFLDTTGNSSLAIAICDRCKLKFPIGELRPDGNSPGLMVCVGDWDQLDPYRLPPRSPDDITLAFVRPDTDIGTNPYGLITTDGDGFLVTQDGEEYLLP